MPLSLRTTALGYLLHRIGFRVLSFFDHWYRGGTEAFLVLGVGLIRSLDRTFAVRITLRNLLRPLYNDYSVVGRIIGPIFRLVRVLVGSVLYVAIALVVLFLYVLWLLVPPTILLSALRGFL